MTNLVHRAIVERVEQLTPGMIRIVLAGPGLKGFETTGIGDEYLRVFLPGPGQDTLNLPVPSGEYWEFPDGVEPAEVRTYTVRGWNAERGELTIDFVVHDGGVAAAWALRAAPGDECGVNTPKGLYDPPQELRWQLLVADATGLPAAARLLENSPSGVRTRVVLEVEGSEHEQPLTVPPGTEVRWVHAGNGHGPSMVEEIVRSAALPTEPGYVWVAGETRTLRGVRRYLRHELKLPSSAYKVVGYWTENAEAWREAYENLPEETKGALMRMWDDESKDQEAIEDEYEALLESHGL